MRVALCKPPSHFCQPTPKMATSAQPGDFYVTAENQVKFSPDLAEVKPSLDDDAGYHPKPAVPKTSRRAEQIKQVGKIAYMCLAAPIVLPISLAITLPLIPVVAVVNIGLFLADELAYHLFEKELLTPISIRTTSPIIKRLSSKRAGDAAPSLPGTPQA